DRRQEIVFIGAGYSPEAIRDALDDCLIGPEDEFNPRLGSCWLRSSLPLRDEPDDFVK
ncbi:MAG: cobalamin biosynthesis protein CobW, partial [Cytophagaceae bacterium]